MYTKQFIGEEKLIKMIEPFCDEMAQKMGKNQKIINRKSEVFFEVKGISAHDFHREFMKVSNYF